jgi:hypothetical protein
MGRGRLRLVSCKLRTSHRYAGELLRSWKTNICQASVCDVRYIFGSRSVRGRSLFAGGPEGGHGRSRISSSIVL